MGIEGSLTWLMFPRVSLELAACIGLGLGLELLLHSGRHRRGIGDPAGWFQRRSIVARLRQFRPTVESNMCV